MIGTADELAAQGIAVPKPSAASTQGPLGRRFSAIVDVARGCAMTSTRCSTGRWPRRSTLLIGSTMLLRFAYQ